MSFLSFYCFFFCFDRKTSPKIFCLYDLVHYNFFFQTRFFFWGGGGSFDETKTIIHSFFLFFFLDDASILIIFHPKIYFDEKKVFILCSEWLNKFVTTQGSAIIKFAIHSPKYGRKLS